MNGGLGNQLFQYAAARFFSLDKNSDFLMNLSFYNREYVKKLAHIDFKLNHFNVDINKQIEEEDIDKYDNVQKIVEPLSSQNFSEFIDFSKYSGNIHLKGFWQNEKYFKHNQEIIKKEFQVITPPNKKIRNFSMKFLNVMQFVCISEGETILIPIALLILECVLKIIIKMLLISLQKKLKIQFFSHFLMIWNGLRIILI